MKAARLLPLLACALAPGALADEPPRFSGDSPYPWRTIPNAMRQEVIVKNMTTDRSLLASGYIFFSPSIFAQGWGPKIYTVDGEPIWDGTDAMTQITQQFYACDYLGSKLSHLCWHEASALGPERQGKANDEKKDWHRVFDNTYQQVGNNFTTTGSLDNPKLMEHFWSTELVKAPSDSHEFHMVDNGESYLQIVYYRRPTDLRAWKGPKAGFTLDSCFQEVSTRTEEVLFTWCYLDHLPLESHLYLHIKGQTNATTGLAGDGEWFLAWDYFHINSADKNEEGDYLISGRHNDQVIKIAGNNSPNGKPSQTLWRLGGDSNQFKFVDDWTFSRQHHARYVNTTNEWTTFTMFDNVWEGELPLNTTTSPYSSGKVVAINNKTMEARLLAEFPHPEGKKCRSGGSFQLLPNGNYFAGWGFERDVSEFHPNGTLLYHAHLRNADGLEVNNYRNYKFEWTATPAAPPRVVAYSRACEAAPLVVYASWNGATALAGWRFSIGNYPRGPWLPAGSAPKADLEAKAVLADGFHAYVRAEALDARGRVLAATVAPTWVPIMRALADGDCDAFGCLGERYLTYDAALSSAGACPKPYSLPILSLALYIVLAEVLAYGGMQVLWARAARASLGDAYSARVEPRWQV